MNATVPALSGIARNPGLFVGTVFMVVFICSCAVYRILVKPDVEDEEHHHHRGIPLKRRVAKRDVVV